MTQDIDSQLLTRTAFNLLTADLEGHGNVLSQWHRAALLELVDTLTGYCAGTTRGRKAFGLPTGMGKTSALVAFIAALDRLGYAVPVSVAASKVEALCSLQRDLLDHGVEPGRIGLKHSAQDASEPSTGSESRLFQLVTHARVRSGRDFELFGTHEGRPRALMIYDETLWRSETLAFDVSTLKASIAALGELVGRRDIAPALLAFLGECGDIISSELQALRERGDPEARGAVVSLPEREEHELDAYAQAVAGSRLPADWKDSLGQFIGASRVTLRVLATHQDSGIVHCREVIPAALRNVVILDASAPVRELARLDTTVEQVESFPTADLKRFDDVEVFQLPAGGGRSTITESFRQRKAHASAVSLEVVDIVRENWGRGPGGFLVFTYKAREVDFVETLRRDLAAAGIDLSATTPEGKPRVRFLTFGDETSLNGLEDCTTVILCGLLQRSHLDIAAAIRGQKADPSESTPGHLVREVIETEAAHVAYQAASRGSCRRVTNGRAHPMRLYVIHRNVGLRHLMARVMPHARWQLREPRHLKTARAEGQTVEILAVVLDHLRQLPATTLRISSRKLKEALQLPKDETTKKQFTRAMQRLADETSAGWKVDGQSLVRSAVAYGFLTA